MAVAPIPLTVFPYRVSDGASNMATDEAMMVLARRDEAALRFYGWSPWCLSLGRNQPATARLMGKERRELRIGVDVVRRPTGGRSVFHGPELTYAFVAPDRALGGPRALNRRLHRALSAGLGALGVVLDARDSGARTRATATDLGPDGGACFRDPAPDELTANGRKLVGSAQCRVRGALLQHGSILLSDHQALGDLDPDPAGPDGDESGAVGLEELLVELPHVEEMVETLSRAVMREFDETAPRLAESPGDALPGVEAARVRYLSDEWQWRR